MVSLHKIDAKCYSVATFNSVIPVIKVLKIAWLHMQTRSSDSPSQHELGFAYLACVGRYEWAYRES